MNFSFIAITIITVHQYLYNYLYIVSSPLQGTGFLRLETVLILFLEPGKWLEHSRFCKKGKERERRGEEWKVRKGGDSITSQQILSSLGV